MNHIPLGPLDLIMPVVIAVLFIFAASLLREPARRRYMAVFVGGAGAAYINGGFGGVEFAFVAVASYVAYRGLESHRFIGVAWLMHTVWDIAHHLYGNPIIHTQPTSSAGCAITDALIAVWFLLGAPSAYRLFRGGSAEDSTDGVAQART